MAQDVGGTSIKANAVATTRLPTALVKLDWANAGFGSYAAWTDETAYLKSLQGSMSALDFRRGLGAIGGGVANQVVVRLQNPEAGTPYSGLRFSPSNENGPLYSQIGNGTVSMVRAGVEVGFIQGATPERVKQLVGYVVDLKEDYAGREVLIELRDRAADLALTRTSTAMYPGVAAKAYLEALCALSGRDPVGSGDQLFDAGMFVVPYQWMDDETLWEEAGHVAEAQLGRIWFDKEGDLHFDDGTHFVRPQTDSWDNPLVSQATLTVDDFRACDPYYDPRSVYNHIVVEYQPRYVAVVQTVFTLAEPLYIPPKRSGVNGETTFRAEFHYPVASLETATKETDWQVISAGGTVLNDSITIQVAGKANYAEVTVQNASTDHAGYLVFFQLRGRPVLSQQAVKVEVEEATSIARYGRRTWRITNPYIQTHRHADAVARALLARYKDPVMVLELNGVPGLPWLEPGDRVTVTEALTGLDEPFFVGQIGWSYDARGGYLMNLALFRGADPTWGGVVYPLDDYFRLGVSKYGTGAGHGHLFW